MRLSMNSIKFPRFFLIILLTDHVFHALSLSSKLNRRQLFSATIGTATSSVLPSLVVKPEIAIAAIDGDNYFAYEKRDRNKNKQAVIRDDYWYFTGRLPPRRFDPNAVVDDPKYNAWGACSTSTSGGNSCTYVSLNQKTPAYSKYFFSINSGAKDYTELGKFLEEAARDPTSDSVWEKASTYVQQESSSFQPPIVDSLLKMVLLATGLLSSPNYTGPPLELLVARFYVNEVGFALSEITKAISSRDTQRANAAYDFGRDSWNSYFTLVNRAIVPKVGEKFEMIA